MEEPFMPAEEAAAMGVSHEAYDQITAIVGHLPTMGELSTLLAMWQSNGQQQSLYGWLRGQHHLVERESYLYDGSDTTHRNIREPRVQECIEIARTLCQTEISTDFVLNRSELIYLVGNISTDFLDSEYGRRYLHISTEPRSPEEAWDTGYTELILSALHSHGIIHRHTAVGNGGLFRTLAAGSTETVGFDILTCREIRLDAFLFGEESGRSIATLDEESDDTFLTRLDEARLNCCFLGRTTKGRVLVDGMDFGPATYYCQPV